MGSNAKKRICHHPAQVIYHRILALFPPFCREYSLCRQHIRMVATHASKISIPSHPTWIFDVETIFAERIYAHHAIDDRAGDMEFDMGAGCFL